jgi:oligopeptidase B
MSGCFADPALAPVLQQGSAGERGHGDQMTDPYAWLRHREDPAVRARIEAENRYADARLAPTRALHDRLYEEMLERVDLNRTSLPVRDGVYEYYSRNQQDKAYPIHCRRRLDPDAPEEIILDENELADGQDYFALEFLRVSPDHNRCLFGIDTAGGERLSLFVKEFAQDSVRPAVPGSVADAVWANDSQTFFSIRLDDRNRPFQFVRHRCDRGQSSPEGDAGQIILEERDEAFRLRTARTENRAFLVLTSWAHDTTELHCLSADEPDGSVHLLHLRRSGIEAYATHYGREFFILTNEGAPGKKIVAVPASDPVAAHARIVLDERPGIEINQLQVFADYFVVWERCEGLCQLRVIDMRDGSDHLVALPEPVYSLYPEDNREFETATLRFGYDSLTAPYAIYDYRMADRCLQMRQRSPVKGYDPAAYRSERILVSTADGARVPLSLVYRDGLQRDGSHPALLYGYGAYGYCVEPQFSSLRLSLLDRGFVYAIAHARGGGELGRSWHEQGKGRFKHNSFSDFIACAEHLICEHIPVLIAWASWEKVREGCWRRRPSTNDRTYFGLSWSTGLS